VTLKKILTILRHLRNLLGQLFCMLFKKLLWRLRAGKREVPLQATLLVVALIWHIASSLCSPHTGCANFPFLMDCLVENLEQFFNLATDYRKLVPAFILKLQSKFARSTRPKDMSAGTVRQSTRHTHTRTDQLHFPAGLHSRRKLSVASMAG
jgi:hypothetical protein